MDKSTSQIVQGLGNNEKTPHISCFNIEIERIYHLINTAKRNKQYIGKYYELLKPIIQALCGMDASFLQNAEFYSDLKETLDKMYNHLVESSKRKAITRFLMTNKNQQVFMEMQKHIDTLCGRVFLSNAYRMELRSTSNKFNH